MTSIVDVVVAELREGRPVVIPTDTVYGLAVDPTRRGALAKVFELKGRPAEMPVAVLVADRRQLRGMVADPLPESAQQLIDRHWPGPLTVVVARDPRWAVDLGGAPDTVGVRCPDHDLVRAVAAAAGPLATTSANRHGEPTPVDAAGVAQTLGGGLLVVDGGPCEGAASTVVDCTGPELVVLRRGAIEI